MGAIEEVNYCSISALAYYAHCGINKTVIYIKQQHFPFPKTFIQIS